ncbi:hypothetical protein T4E_5151 [Trichinella pseudospiralis]|uniref:Uncharacterized protein n=1 Tax=Trichinella pseudospiralis TaxID=6337 RepID=A0A0V0YBG7_TRIPS|nr:hypothetical protein T4E_5151 [Trichinella pseudospiralis]
MTDNDTPFLFASADWRNLACSIAIMQIISQQTFSNKNLKGCLVGGSSHNFPSSLRLGETDYSLPLLNNDYGRAFRRPS